MKSRYDIFGLITIIGMAAILIFVAVSILVKSSPIGEKFILLGMWVILSFFIMVGVEGNARGILRQDVKVPWKLAIISFVFAGLLFVIGGIVGVT